MYQLDLLRIENLTAGIEIYSPTSTHTVELVEWGEQLLIFQSPARALPGQLVSLIGVLTMNGQSHRFEATGRIQSVMPEVDRLNRFEIFLQQFDRQLWGRFLLGLKAKQNRADQIFASIRGEDR